MKGSHEIEEPYENRVAEIHSVPTGEEEIFVSDCFSAEAMDRTLLRSNDNERSRGDLDNPFMGDSTLKAPGHSTQGSLQHQTGSMLPSRTPVLRTGFAQQCGLASLQRSRSNVLNESQNWMLNSIGNSDWDFPIPSAKRSISKDLTMSLDHLDLSARSVLSDCQRLVLPGESGTIPPPPPELNSSAGTARMDSSQEFPDMSDLDLLLSLQRDDSGIDGQLTSDFAEREPLTAAQVLLRKQHFSNQKNNQDSSSWGAVAINRQPLIVQARYANPNHTVEKKDRTSIVMSSTRKEWLSKLSGHTTGIRGAVIAAGSIANPENEAHMLRKVMVVVPAADELHPVKPIFRINVSSLNKAFGSAMTEREVTSADTAPESPKRDLRNFALTKPSFSPFETGVMALGSEEHPSTGQREPMLMVTQVP